MRKKFLNDTNKGEKNTRGPKENREGKIIEGG